MKTITLLNEKGGVCKTTLAIHTAAGLAISGKRVVLIDTDPQGHCGYYFGIEPDASYYNLVARNGAWNDILHTVTPELYEQPGKPARGSLQLVMGNKSSRNIGYDVDDVAILRKRLSELQDVDVVIIDTSPTPSLAMLLVYEAADAVIYPTELARLSLQSFINSLQSRENDMEVRTHPLDILGIVPTKTRMNTIEHEENHKMLVDEFGDLVWSPTSLSIVWEEAAGQSRTVFAYAPDSPATKQMWAIVNQTEKALEKLGHDNK
jgi:chromosome partitioning protein